MKKVCQWILYGVAIALTLAFIVVFIVDCVRYDPNQNSAPLEAILLLRAVAFLLPALLALVGAILIKKFKK